MDEDIEQDFDLKESINDLIKNLENLMESSNTNDINDKNMSKLVDF